MYNLPKWYHTVPAYNIYDEHGCFLLKTSAPIPLFLNLPLILTHTAPLSEGVSDLALVLIVLAQVSDSSKQYESSKCLIPLHSLPIYLGHKDTKLVSCLGH